MQITDFLQEVFQANIITVSSTTLLNMNPLTKMFTEKVQKANVFNSITDFLPQDKVCMTHARIISTLQQLELGFNQNQSKNHDQKTFIPNHKG